MALIAADPVRHSGVVWAAEYVVRPWEDFSRATERLQPGDTLRFADGYHLGTISLLGVRGTALAPVTITADPNAVIHPVSREAVWCYNSSHIVFERLRVGRAARAGIILNSSTNITIRYCTVMSNALWGIQSCLSDYITVDGCDVFGSREQHGIYFSTTDHPVVRNSRIHDNPSCGIHMNGDVSEGGDGMVSGGLIENNLIYRNGRRGGAALNMDSVEGTEVRNNLIFDNQAGGIVTFHRNGLRSGAGNVFRGNTVYFPPGAGLFALALSQTDGKTTVERNVLVCGNGPALDIDSRSSAKLQAEGNVYFTYENPKPIRRGFSRRTLAEWRAMTGLDQTSFHGDPRLAAPAQSDFTPAKHSPAILLRAGSTVAAPVKDVVRP
jgi:parallel beta-helix repeat protein